MCWLRKSNEEGASKCYSTFLGQDTEELENRVALGGEVVCRAAMVVESSYAAIDCAAGANRDGIAVDFVTSIRYETVNALTEQMSVNCSRTLREQGLVSCGESYSTPTEEASKVLRSGREHCAFRNLQS